MTYVAFAGDWHGDSGWAAYVIDLCAQANIKTIYHLGDFGVWPGDRGYYYLDHVNKCLEDADIDMVVVGGNHEDYDQIESWPIREDGWIEARSNLLFAPRGFVWEHGVRFAAMGGALSIDKSMRTRGISWWPQEAITEANLITLEQNLAGEPVDIFLSHDFPEGSMPGPTHRFALPEALERESQVQREMLRAGVDMARPKVLLHGHWHVRMNNVLETPEYRTEVIGLDMQGTNGNVVVMDLDSPDLGVHSIYYAISEFERTQDE